MAEGVVSFGVEKLLELLSRESERLNGIDEQVAGLKRQLRRLQSLVKDAYAKKHESERVRTFLEDVQDIVYDADDIIESFLLKESRGKEKGIKKRVKRLACFLVDRWSFAFDIGGITKRISEVIEGMQSFGIPRIIDGGRSLSLQERQREQREIRQTFPNDLESDLVGVEQSVEELVGCLVENDNNIQVVSISGMGGIGKTTLARQVFHHGSVRRRFEGFAWVCVSQEFTQKHIWQRILKYLRPHDEDVLNMDEFTLQGKLFRLLETSRYLIVLDDVWKNEDWDRIKAVFPPNKGWKMLLTSRNEGVGLHADPTCYVFRPKILTPEESWNLCKRIVFPRRDETIDEELEARGKKMVTYCGGLPLAVKVLGGLLATKHTVSEWERICDNIGPRIVGGTSSSIVDDNNPNSLNRVLSMSYENLPVQLKHCFLYLAHFPEDHTIDEEHLFSCWAAEGMIMPYSDGPTILEIGEEYMEELVRRNMVISGGKYATSRKGHIQMHDTMREVCLSKAKEENFLQVVKAPTTFTTSAINSQFPSKPRRLVVNCDTFDMLRYKSNPKVRSLFCFTLGGENFSIKSAQVFRNLPLLRVLDLSWVKLEGGVLPSSIGELIHLRFLSLDHARVYYLPSSLRNLKLLLHLNLGVSWNPVHVPNVLKEMLELRYLTLPRFMHNKTKLELSDLVNLESLSGFSAEHSSETDLLCMTKLKTLRLHLNRFSSETPPSILSKLRNLEKLCLSRVSENRSYPFLLGQHHFPPHLAHISLYKCYMQRDPMRIIEKLLHLKSVELSSGAFGGGRMVCSAGGFPQLRALEITGQERLERWTVEEGSMPCLHTLAIDNCTKLRELPYGLKYVISLKELKITYMKKEWTDKLEQGGEDYYKVQHIPSVQLQYK